MRIKLASAVLILCLSPLALGQPPAPPDAIADKAEELVTNPGIGGLGIAAIKAGEVAWVGYYGEQGPGIPVTSNTMFNTASVAKTVLAETVLRMVQQDHMQLDDPIYKHYQHPDLKDDPRYRQLTPRLILSHQTGLLNWPYLYEDGRLAFVDDPGQGEIKYSGAAVRMLARYLEERFDKSYPEIVEEVLFGPLEVEEISVARTEALQGRVPHPRTSDGRVFEPFSLSEDAGLIEPGQWSAADNLFATVEGYADFLAKLIAGGGLSEELIEQRQTLHSSSDIELGYQCILPESECPSPLGFGLGWALFGEPQRMILNHSGNDFGEHAQVYFSPESGDGLVLFVDGGNAWIAGLELMERLDPDLRMARHYRALHNRMMAEQQNQADGQ